MLAFYATKKDVFFLDLDNFQALNLVHLSDSPSHHYLLVFYIPVALQILFSFLSILHVPLPAPGLHTISYSLFQISEGACLSHSLEEVSLPSCSHSTLHFLIICTPDLRQVSDPQNYKSVAFCGPNSGLKL